MKKVVFTAKAPAPIGPYSQAVISNGTLYISGQIAIDPESGSLMISDIREETTRVMENLKAILTEVGSDFTKAIKCSIFLSDMTHFSAVNEIYAGYFTDGQAPARETVAVRTLPRNVNVEISMIAEL